MDDLTHVNETAVPRRRLASRIFRFRETARSEIDCAVTATRSA